MFREDTKHGNRIYNEETETERRKSGLVLIRRVLLHPIHIPTQLFFHFFKGKDRGDNFL